MWTFVDKHLTPLLIAGGILLFIVVALSIILFRELTVHYERTRKAALRFVQIILGIRLAAKGDPAADDALAKTISQPMPAPKMPEKKP